MSVRASKMYSRDEAHELRLELARLPLEFDHLPRR
jgi:hypothetical protein